MVPILRPQVISMIIFGFEETSLKQPIWK